MKYGAMPLAQEDVEVLTSRLKSRGEMMILSMFWRLEISSCRYEVNVFGKEEGG